MFMFPNDWLLHLEQVSKVLHVEVEGIGHVKSTLRQGFYISIRSLFTTLPSA